MTAPIQAPGSDRPAPSAAPLLGRPLALASGGVLANRLAKSAMSERLGTHDDHAPTEALVHLYRRWAKGGAGLLVTGNVMVDHQALAEPGNVVVAGASHLPLLEAWAEAGRAGGAELWMQLNHPGRQSPRSLSRQPVAPSVVPLERFGMSGVFAPPRALDAGEIRRIVNAFGSAAEVAARAGFTGVQVHAAHGYLVSQFLSPWTNRREDEWGGSPENRRRFLLEVLQEIHSRTPSGFSVSVKLNSSDFQRGGFTEEESLEVIGALGGAGVDLLEISGGTYERTAMFQQDWGRTSDREAFFLEFARRARQVSTVPVMLTGGFRSAAAMERALAEGAVDVVGLGRPLIVEPDLPRHLLEGTVAGATPVRLGVGHRALDGLVSVAWYSWQLNRMGRGLEPAAGASRLRALLAYLSDHARPTRPVRVEPRLARGTG